MTGYWKPCCIWLFWIFIAHESIIAASARTKSKVPPAMIRLWYYTYGKELSWGRSYGDYAQVDRYLVTVNCTKDNEIFRFSSTEQKVKVRGLPSDQCCYADVAAANKFGVGPRSKKRAINPVSPKTSYRIDQYSSKFGEDNITLTWTTKPYPTPGTIYKFEVTIGSGSQRWSPPHGVSKNLMCRGPDCLYPCDVKVGPSDEEFDQKEVYFSVTLPTKPAKQYNVDITSHVVGRYTGRMNGVYNFMTSPAVPSSPVREVKMLAKNESAIIASWLAPIERNGAGLKYNVSLSYGKQNCLVLASSDEYYIPVTIYRTLEVRKDNKYYLTGLKPFTKYTLSVNAMNYKGHGHNWTTPLVVSTDPRKVLKGQLRNLKTNVDSRSFEVTWDPACPIEGPVSSYSIDVYNRGQLVSTFETNNTFINIPVLKPDTFYTTHVRGTNTQIESSVDALTKVEINVCMNKWETLRDYLLGKFDESRVSVKDEAARMLDMDNEYSEILLEPEIGVNNTQYFENLLPTVEKLDSADAMQFRWEVKLLLLKYLECQKTPDMKPWI